MSLENKNQLQPLAIISGARTPFAKSFGALRKVSAVELGVLAVKEAIASAGLTENDINETIIGNVSGPADAANIGRVISLKAGIPEDRIAHTVNRNCGSGLESIVTGWQAIESGRSRVVVAGGTESMSQVPLLWPPEMMEIMLKARKARSLSQRMGAYLKLRPRHFKPIPALELGLTDPTCGLNMGQTAELIAKEFGITREMQDAFALRSHQRVAQAQERCFMSGEVIALPQRNDEPILQKDDGVRPGQSLNALRKLRPVFDRENGTITAGNSCPISDGAGAVVLKSASEAETGDASPLGYVTAYAITGCDPRRMGLGPVFAITKLLDQTGMSLNDIDLIEINEAFAAQVLACTTALASDQFAKDHLSRASAVGEIDPERLNINGGAIALGHPVGATGTRILMTLLRSLKEQGLQRGIASLCIGGGQGMALLLQRELN
ncbi:thiolase family protein [Calycomorphotria hydatis]|uniref:3-ketoacyl-CoA thiolase n=1 Tax=Calycomorphotria hydatis TaxID=2528027 RepID=A0A517T9F9_9PLAN|nr:thiolase family protein [Calycomorphotria hydatis]QDT64998.1 3-ketoacyl-CoA thiolase [Calycomorphotria hydatis]